MKKTTKWSSTANIPPHFQTQTPITRQQHDDKESAVSMEAESKKKKWHMPLLRLRVNDVSCEGAEMFFNAVNPKRLMEEAVRGVMETLYTKETQPTNVRSVTLIIRSMSGVAYTNGSDIDEDHKEIHLSTEYLKGVHERSEGKLDRSEILGVIRHEMVHCFQFNAKGTANGGLIEGIADWVRFKAGFIPPHWKKGGGNEWDDGYQNTAYFLLYLEKLFGKDTVPKINEYMRHNKYSDKLWKELFDHEVKDLWKEYKKSLDEKDSNQPVVPAPGETCMGGLKEEGKGKEKESGNNEDEDLEDSLVVVEHPNFDRNDASAKHKHAMPQDIPCLKESFVSARFENDEKRHILIAATGSVASIKIPLILKTLSAHRRVSVRLVLTTASLLFLPPLQTLLEIPNVDGIYMDHHEWPSSLQTEQPLPPQPTSSSAPSQSPIPRPHKRQRQSEDAEESAIWAKVGDPILHIELRRWAHILLIAPLSANSLAKITSGFTDNLLLSVIRAWDRTRKIAIAPAMNTMMWEHPLTQQQLKLLNDTDENGVTSPGSWDWFEVLKPANKTLACGDKGTGAMMEWSEIVAWLVDKMDLAETGSKA